MSKRHRRNRPIHHEDIDVLGLTPRRGDTVPTRVHNLATSFSQPRSTSKSNITPQLLHPPKTGGSTALTPAHVQKINNAVTKVSTTTSHLRASAAKNKKLRAKLLKIADSLDKKATSLKTQVAQAGGFAPKPSSARSSIMGTLFGINPAAISFVDPTVLLNAAVQAIAQSSEADALSVASDINQEMSDNIDQLNKLPQVQRVTDLISQATNFGNQAYDIVNNYDKDAGDPTVPQRVAALQSQIYSWNPSLYSVLGDKTLNPNATPPPSNTTPPPSTTMTLSRAMTPTDTVAYVNSTTGAPPQGIIQIDNEQMMYSAVTPTSFTGLQRAYSYQYDGSYPTMPPAAHAAGATVTVVPSTSQQYPPPPFDTGGGGYGGGGGSLDEGESDAVAQFRQGIDPFADEDDGSIPVVPEDSGGSTADAGMSQQDLDRALLEQDSGDGSFTAAQLLSAVQQGQDEPLTPEGAAPGGTYSAEDYALLENDSPEIPDTIVGSINWGQIFYNPAGILLDYMNRPQPAHFQAHVATPTNVASWRTNTAAQQNLTAAQARLAQAQAALAAGRKAYLQQLMAATGATGTLPDGTSPLPLSSPLDRYSSSGAFIGPIKQDWSTPQPAPTQASTPTSTDQGTDMPTDDSTTDVLGDDDIIIDSYEYQVTDAEPSFERGSASRHGGAAYLDPTYPRGGSVAGRQGGLIQPEEKIIVGHNKHDVFFGGCYEHGLDVLGAMMTTNPRKLGSQSNPKTRFKSLPQRAGFVQQKTPKGRTFTSLKLNKVPSHAASIKNARDAGKRAISVADKIEKQVKNAALAVHKTAIKGDLLGASKIVADKVAHHLVTSAQVLKAAKAARDLGQKTLKAADKHQKLIDTLNAKNKTAAARAAEKLKMGSAGKSTVIKGIDDETADLIFGAQLEVLGTCVPDPNDPGWCLDGTVDPNYGGAGGGGGGGVMPPGYGAVPDPNNPGYLTDGTPDPNYAGGGTVSAGPPDYGIGPPPTPESVEPKPYVDYDPDPFPNGGEGDINQYSSDPAVPGTPVPIGAVIYDGSNPPEYLGLGSYTTFFGQLPSGAPPEGGAGPAMPPGGSYASGGSGYQWHDDGWYSFRKNDWPGPAGSGDYRLKKAEDSSQATGPARAANSFNYNWGPMIGNPHGSLRGLRYDVAGNQWFWYYDQAPDWAKQPVRQALINKAILDYQAQLAAAAADYAAQQAADKLAAEQAKQLQQQQALEDAKMQHELEIQQQQAQQAAAAQALADEAAARQQQQQDESYARRTQAEAEAQAKLEQSEMLTQAQIEQQAAETAARLDAMAAAQMPTDADTGAYVPNDGSYDDSGEAAPYDGYANAKAVLESEE